MRAAEAEGGAPSSAQAAWRRRSGHTLDTLTRPDGKDVLVILGGARRRRFEPSETVDITSSDERPEA